MERLYARRQRFEFYQVVVPHDLEGRWANVPEQMPEARRVVALRLLGRLEAVRTAEEIAREHQRVDLFVGRLRQEPLIDRCVSVQVGRTVKTKTRPYLDDGEIAALMARRDLIVARFDSLVAEKGEAPVLY